MTGLMTFALLLQPVVADTLDEPVEPTTPAAPDAAACQPGSHDVPIASELGSAGIMYNIAEHPESIRAVAGRLLNEALTRLKKADPAVKCDSCTSDAEPRIVYRVAPVHLLADQEQDPVCRKLDVETAQRPLEFAARHFGSIPELNDWMMAFSQGRGDEGKQLYEQCAANCSPRYQLVIAPVDDGLEVETRVQCGLARDRASDDYEVSTALRIDCNDAAKPVAANTP